MKITDCPHKPGTPEHLEWVKYTFQPDEDVREIHRIKYGAQAIGGRLIFGKMFREFFPYTLRPMPDGYPGGWG